MYLVRWRFEWNDRPAKYGMWSNPGDPKDLTTKAWCNNHEGLKLAGIEIKNMQTREIKLAVYCDGHDFVNFQWVNLAKTDLFGIKGNVTPFTHLVGLTLITRNHRFTVYHDSDKILLEDRTEDDKRINFATFGK